MIRYVARSRDLADGTVTVHADGGNTLIQNGAETMLWQEQIVTLEKAAYDDALFRKALEEAAKLLDALEEQFARFGFQPHPERRLSGRQLRERKSEIENDAVYNSEVYRARRGNVMCSLVLKKSVLKGSSLARMAKIDSDLFMLTLTVENLRDGDRF